MQKSVFNWYRSIQYGSHWLLLLNLAAIGVLAFLLLFPIESGGVSNIISKASSSGERKDIAPISDVEFLTAL